jgi:WD40 repeat protein
LRRQGYTPTDAEDIVQGFFERFLAARFLRRVSPDKGRFRSFLLASLRHYPANVRRNLRTERRGGKNLPIPLDESVALEHCEAALAATGSADAIFDPNGLFLATARFDNAVRLWEAETGNVIANAFRHAEQVNWVAFSPDGCTLATAGEDWLVKFWDVRPSAMLQVTIRPADRADTLLHAALNATGTRVLTVGSSGAVEVRDSELARVVGSDSDTISRRHPEPERCHEASDLNES